MARALRRLGVAVGVAGERAVVLAVALAAVLAAVLAGVLAGGARPLRHGVLRPRSGRLRALAHKTTIITTPTSTTPW